MCALNPVVVMCPRTFGWVRVGKIMFDCLLVVEIEKEKKSLQVLILVLVVTLVHVVVNTRNTVLIFVLGIHIRSIIRFVVHIC